MLRRVLGVVRRAMPIALLVSPPLAAFPQGAPWEAAEQEGCVQCHFDAPPVEDSPALTLEGLPKQAKPGERHRLTVTIRDAEMAKAGLLLSARTEGSEGEPGELVSVDHRIETMGALARSTEAGIELSSAGVAHWIIEWIAPAIPSQRTVLEAWVVAANDDQSPFGDVVHRRRWALPDPSAER